MFESDGKVANDYVYVIYVCLIKMCGDYGTSHDTIIPYYFKSVDSAKKYMESKVPDLYWTEDDRDETVVSNPVHYYLPNTPDDEITSEEFRIARLYTYGGDLQ